MIKCNIAKSSQHLFSRWSFCGATGIPLIETTEFGIEGLEIASNDQFAIGLDNRLQIEPVEDDLLERW